MAFVYGGLESFIQTISKSFELNVALLIMLSSAEMWLFHLYKSIDMSAGKVEDKMLE